MDRLLRIAIAPLIWWIRLWQTPRENVPVLEKFARTAIMVPAFAALLMILRIRLLVRGPLTIDAMTLDGGRFRCHPPDLIQMYLWLFGIWEPDVTHFIHRRLHSGDVFVDVGANIGYYTVLAARSPRPSGVHVVAIEASPTVANDLQESIAMNNLGGAIRIINKAVAARVGRITVFAGPGHNTGLTTTVAERGMPAQSIVDAAPLDDLLTTDEVRRARLIKIDVEGAEPQVLAGMGRVIAESRAGEHGVEIVVELSPQWWSDSSLRPDEVLQPFRDAGFHLYRIENNYWPWRYLWPNCVSRPMRIRNDLPLRIPRIDLVLSRVDAESL